MGSIQKQKAVIIGSGIFGMSTALWMLEDGGYDVLVLDKCGILPAPDAASTDLNKIIRAGDYADPALSELGIEAVEMWRKPEWEGTFHESGVICLGDSNNKESMDFVQSAHRNLLNSGIDAKLVEGTDDIKARFQGQNVKTGDFANRKGYANPLGGWAEAGRAVEVGIKKIRQNGGEVRAGADVVGLLKDGRTVKGVRLKSGEEIYGDLVVCAAGAWTPQLFAYPDVSARAPEVKATGQSVATVQLTPEEAETYSKVSVVFNMDNGFYVFPPNPDGLVKCAIHAAGYINPSEENADVSVPRTKLTPGAEDGMIPLEKLKKLRQSLAEVYPELAKKDFTMTRLCWYCDTISGDWLIDYHPDYDNMILATGGSGHAFKYAPIIGREILKVIRKQTDPRFAKRWSFGYTGGDDGADIRMDEIRTLKVEDLATVDDLKA